MRYLTRTDVLFPFFLYVLKRYSYDSLLFFFFAVYVLEWKRVDRKILLFLSELCTLNLSGWLCILSHR